MPAETPLFDRLAAAYVRGALRDAPRAPGDAALLDLFSAARLSDLLRAHGAARVTISQVPGHLIAVATVTP